MRRSVLLLFASCWLAFPAASQPIDTAYAVSIGGIRQWLSIKSNERNLPVLLFLHGGPGNSVISYADRFTHRLREHFVVVQWDQRESGQTATLNATPVPLTVDLMTSDAVEVINYLCREFGKQKIYLMGHSWGGFLGFMVTKLRPDLLAAYMPVCPMVNQRESERLALDWMKQRANESGNKTALQELSTVTIPFADGGQLYTHRKWLLHFAGSKTPDRDKVLEWSKTWLALFNDASTYDLTVLMPEVQCPVFFFVGGRDYQTSTKLTTAYYTMLKAPKKELYVFEKVAHSVPTSDPSRLQKIVIDEVLRHVSDR